MSLKINKNTWLIVTVLSCLITLNLLGFISIKKTAEINLATCTQTNKNTESLGNMFAALNEGFAQYTKLHPEAPQTIDWALRFSVLRDLRALQIIINNGGANSKEYQGLLVKLRGNVPKMMLADVEAIAVAAHNHPAVDSESLVSQLYKSASAIGTAETIGYFGGFVRLTSLQNSKTNESAKSMISTIEAMLGKPNFIECIGMDEASGTNNGALDKTTAIVLADAKSRLYVNCLINQLVNRIIEQQ